jgi:Uncharacterized protein conserved in bacteria C-term(DUF2220)
MSTVELGVTAGNLARKLDTWPRRRVELGELMALLVTVEPALEHAPERRGRLADVLDELVDADVVELPSARSYDRSARPALPRFVKLDRPAAPARRRSGASVAWRSELAWAGELSFDEQTLADLRAINAFLRDGGAQRLIVPLRERSLQLFGDEKRLETLLGGQLFFDGRLTLVQLRCEPVHPPFVYQPIGTGPDALVIENHHTYVSFARVLPTDGPVGTLIYGAGAHFKASVTFVADLPTRPRRVLYFGDLDAAGLDIPVHADTVAAASGLPGVEAATPLYQLMLDHGRPAPVDDPPSRYCVGKLIAWLSTDIRAVAATVLNDGHRFAQEWVGTEMLVDHAAILRAL